jgi:hypothetical protein
MAVPSSGQLRLRADIANEVDGDATGSNVALGTLADTAGFTNPPDTMAEFYGYTACTVPSVTTNSSDNQTVNSMRINGNVTNDNGCAVTDRGFYFGTSSNYASNSKFSVGSGTGSYNSTRGSLSSSTTYYATAYAINSEGESRGSTVSSATSTPITYTGYSTSNNPRNQMEIASGGMQSLNMYGYGQYLHSQLGWQTDNSCVNGTQSFGTSGTQNGWICRGDRTVAFFPDYRKGSASTDHASSRGTLSQNGSGLPQACCGDNSGSGQRYNQTALPWYGSSSYSYSASPYTANSNGNEGFHQSGCPYQAYQGCNVSISMSYTYTVNRP